MNLCHNHPKKSEKFIIFLILMIIASLIVIYSPVYANSIENSGNNSSSHMDLQNESNESPNLIKYIPESSLSSTSDFNFNTISTPSFLTPNFTGTESILSTVTSGTDQDVSAIWEDHVVWRSVDEKIQQFLKVIYQIFSFTTFQRESPNGSVQTFLHLPCPISGMRSLSGRTGRMAILRYFFTISRRKRPRGLQMIPSISPEPEDLGRSYRLAGRWRNRSRDGSLLLYDQHGNEAPA